MTTLAALLGALPGYGQTVDGTIAGGEGYGAALALQTAATGFGNSTNGAILYATGGSEIDNLHAQVVGSDLYIFIGGNLESNGNTLDLFIDSKSGGQNPIAGGNSSPTAAYTGLTFDAAMVPDYLLGFRFDAGFLQTQYSLLGGGGSNNIGQGNVGGTSFAVDFDLTAGTNPGAVAINNSNTGGVDGSTVNTPASVTKGIEIRIPLSAIGNPTGDIRVTAHINNGDRNYLANQVLGGLPFGTGNLGGDGAGNFTGSVAGVNYASFAGNQYVTIPYNPMVMQPDLGLSPAALRFGSVLTTGGSVQRTFTITNTGNAPLNVSAITSSSAAYSATPNNVAMLGIGLSQLITVTFDPSAAGLQTATLTVVSDAPPATPNTISVNGIGTAPGTALIDGTRDATYPAALAVQTTATGFGDSNAGQEGFANGSELDNVHAQIIGQDLYVFLGGNLEANGNHIELFFDSKPNVGMTVVGQNQLLAGNAGPAGSMTGLRFDAGMNADYAVSVQANGGGGSLSGLNFTYSIIGTANGGGVGSGATPITAHPLDFDLTAGTLAGQGALNNSNTGGVTGSLVGTPGSVDTGIELRIPLSALGTSANNGPIRLTAFVNNNNHSFAANQVLAGLPSGPATLKSIGSVNLASFAGNQFVTIPNGTPMLFSDIAISQTALTFGNISVPSGSGTRTFEISNNGTGNLVVTGITSSNADFTASHAGLTLAPNTSQIVTITFDPSVAGTRNGAITITSNDPDSPTRSVNVSGVGVAAGQVVLDGTLDASLYGPARALQTVPTGFGNNQSELNGAYATVRNSSLHIMLTGNLTNNKVILFIDSNPYAGQETLTNTNPDVDFDGLNQLAGMQFDGGFSSDYFLTTNVSGTNAFLSFAPTNGGGGSGTYLTTSNNSYNQPLAFGGGLGTGEFAYNPANTGGVTDAAVGNPGSVTTGLEYRIPLSAIGNPSASTPIRVMAAVINGSYDFYSNQFLPGLPAGFGNLGGTDPDLRAFAGNQFFTAQRGDILLSSARTIGGDYRNVTVTGTGQATIIGATDATGPFNVASGGKVTFGASTEAVLTGSGTFGLAGGSTLRISSAQGIGGAGTGNVRLATRNFSPLANYEYASTVAQVTGTELPTTVESLTVASASTLTLSRDLAVRHHVSLPSGNLAMSIHELRLLSGPTGTAYLDNVQGTGGTVQGAFGAMECYLATSTSAPAYHHYGTPMTPGVRVQDLNTVGYAPIINNAYNTTPFATRFEPGVVSPYPNFFRYDEAQVSTDFSEGYRSPAAFTEQLVPGRGYALAMQGRPELTFEGTFQNADVAVSLTNTAGNGVSGWHLVANPFPQTVDWAQATIPGGMDGAVWAWVPANGANALGGSYVSYNNGMGTFSGLIAPMQGVFVRRNAAGAPVNFTFSQLMRTNSSAGNHFRAATDTRPVVSLLLSGTGTLAAESDAVTVYFEDGATAGLDSRMDARKLAYSSGDVPTIATRLADGVLAQIDGRPALTRDMEVPLLVAVNRAGTYVLSTKELRNFAADQAVLLVDALTGTTQDLRTTATYRVALDPATAATPRFSLRFGAGKAASAALNAASALLQVYPNPSTGTVNVTWAGDQALSGTATLTDLLGRTVRTAAVTGTRLTLNALPKGVYSLRVETPAGVVTRRVVVE